MFTSNLPVASLTSKANNASVYAADIPTSNVISALWNWALVNVLSL